MHIVIYCLSLFYTGCVSLLRWGISRIKPGRSPERPWVSVIVAARNEADNIRMCIHALQKQTYPKDLLEIIIVDDRSEDRTADIVREESEKDPRIQLIPIIKKNAEMSPKKWALHQGILKAKGEILCFTDADCIPSAVWIESLITYFDPDVGLVAGYSPLTLKDSPTLFHRLIALDGLALAGVAAGSFGLNLPLTCSGRSIAYRKTVYHEVSGFSSIGQFISGDDDLFLHLIRQQTAWKMRYCLNPEAVVPTSPPRTLRQFSAQRTRHASKGFHYPWGLIIGLICVYLLNVSLLVGLFFPSCYLAVIIGFLLKTVAEFGLVEKMARTFKQSRLLSSFPLAAFIHIPYVVIFGLWGQIGRFEWKNKHFDKMINKD